MGYLEITFGPMFSGKTNALIENINNYITFQKIKNKDPVILIINNIVDRRENNISILSTHESVIDKQLKSDKIHFQKIKNLYDLDISYVNQFDYIAIDECQFFEDLEPFVRHLLTLNKYVHCSGLVGDSEKRNFGHLYKLFCLADEIRHLKAYCNYCDKYEKNAVFTKWISSKNKDNVVEIGDKEKYVPVCGNHY